MKMLPIKYRKCSTGFSLVELMIAITLGIILVTSVLNVFLNNKLLINAEVSLSRIQESGRLVMELFTKDLRKVGYHGCSNPADMNIIVMAASGVNADFGATSLRGFEVGSGGTFTPTLDGADSLIVIHGSGSQKARVGSDVLQIKYADRIGAKLTSSTDPVNTSFQVDSNPSLVQNDIVIVSDCQSAHIFAITNNPASSGTIIIEHAASNNSPHKMLPGYASGADLLSYRDVTYFVADTGRNNGNSDVYSLYRKFSTSDTLEELVEGVEFLQVLYGEKLASGNIRFVSAGTAGLSMQAVVAIKVAVLVQDFDVGQIGDDNRTYSLLNTAIASSGSIAHSGGRYLRKPFSATVQLRNAR